MNRLRAVLEEHVFRAGRERRRADDVKSEIPGLIVVQEVGNVAAGADQEHALRSDEAMLVRRDHGTDQRVARDDEHREPGGVEQDRRAARIDVRDLGQKTEREQAEKRDLPDIDRTPDVVPEGEIVRQRIFAAHDVEDREQAGGGRAHGHGVDGFAERAIDQGVIGNARDAGRRDDRQHVGRNRDRTERIADDGGPAPRRQDHPAQISEYAAHGTPRAAYASPRMGQRMGFRGGSREFRAKAV